MTVTATRAEGDGRANTKRRTQGTCREMWSTAWEIALLKLPGVAMGSSTHGLVQVSKFRRYLSPAPKLVTVVYHLPYSC